MLFSRILSILDFITLIIFRNLFNLCAFQSYNYYQFINCYLILNAGNEALSISDALDLSFYRWAIHYLEHRAAVSAASSRPNAARSSRTGPAARRFRRLLSRLNWLARRDPDLLLDENDRQVLHSAASELTQPQRPAVPAAASAEVEESAQGESGSAVREATVRRPTLRSSMPHPYRDELRCRMLCRAYNLHKCICTRD